MVSSLMGDSTALASAIVRCCPKPSASNIVTLAKIFCVSTDYLFGLERRNPLYIDHLPESEQLRVRFLVQAYTDMVQKELQKGTVHF